MTEEEYYAAIKRMDALQDCRNDEECGELERLTALTEKFVNGFFTLGSGNVFEDLGLDNPEEELRRSQADLDRQG